MWRETKPRGSGGIKPSREWETLRADGVGVGKPAQRSPELLSPKGAKLHGRCRRTPAACLAQPLHLGGARPRGNLRSVLLTDLSTSVVMSPGKAPKGSAASLTASAAFDNAEHARHPHLGEDVAQFVAKPFAVSSPSGVATRCPRTSVHRPQTNATRPERSGQLRPRVELARHNARAAGHPTTLGSRTQCRMRSTPTASSVFLPRALHPRIGPARDTSTRRCGHTL
jgi:hypothetical protein